MIGTGLAILGAGLLGAGASMYGANKAANTQADAARSAAAIQQQGQDNALAFQKDVYGGQVSNFADTKSNLQPFISSGVGANNLLNSFYGINGADPTSGQNALDRYRQSPDYKFALQGGTDALDNSAAAKGGLIGGNQIRAQTEYGQGLATQNLNNYLTRLTGMSMQGMQAAGTEGQIGATLGNGVVGSNAAANITGSNNVAQSTMAAGTADASGILGVTKGINSGLNSLSLYSQLGKSSYGSPSSNYLSSYNGNQIGGLY